MPIIPQVQNLTRDQIKARQKILLSSLIINQFTELSRKSDELYYMFWDNKEDVTPQELCDAFGTDAASLFLLFNDIKAFLNKWAPGTATLSPPVPVTLNQNGTVTISTEVPHVS